MPPTQNIVFPQSPFLDPLTQRPSREWILWLQSPNVSALSSATPVPVTSGGTGVGTTPSNGFMLIGNTAQGVYTSAALTAGLGIGITNGAGSVTLTASGVGTFSGGTTGLTPASPTGGAVTLSGTVNPANGGTGAVSPTGILKGNGASPMTAIAGVTGVFTTAGSFTVTVTNGVITSIV